MKKRAKLVDSSTFDVSCLVDNNQDTWTFDFDSFDPAHLEDFEPNELFLDEQYDVEPWWDYEVDGHEGCDKMNLYSDGSGEQHTQPDVSRASDHFIGRNVTNGPVVRIKENLSRPQLVLADLVTALSKHLFNTLNAWIYL